MADAATPPQRGQRTIILFGDATDSWVDGIDQLYSEAVSTPWLRHFLDQMTNVVATEARATTMDRSLQDSLGYFSSLQELGDRYRHSSDDFGLVQAILLHAARAGLVGLSGGLLSAAALAVADSFEALCDACLEAARFIFRVAKFASVKSRAMEEQPGTWGWAVLGMAPGDLHEALEQFQRANGISSKKAKVGVVGNGWATVIGPPSVLQLVLHQCSAIKGLAKNPLEIKAAQHTLDISTAERDSMVGSDPATLHRQPSGQNHQLWGMDDPAAVYANWGEMLKDICMQVLSRPLDITKVVDGLKSKLDGVGSVRILQPGTVCSHTLYVANMLKKSGIDVAIPSQTSFLGADGAPATGIKPGRIAIVGMSGRGPGSDNVEEFWDLIMSKKDLCSEIPKDRFDIDEYFCPAHERGDERCKMKIRYGCFMDNPGHFDSRFFHISPREALLMDPNHRQFLTSTYEALESAGYADGKTTAVDPNRIGAFFAQATDDWHKQTHPTLRSFGSGRLAWQFKWEGPTYALDSACAGTTSSIHLACLSLLEKDIDMAVTGAANILSWPHSFTCLDDSGILSPTGNYKTFRDDADGYCRGDFVGAVVLKRLEDAVAQNDNILAVIAASGRNHSGNSTSITTSDAAAQERLFRKVMLKAQVSPDDISYVEMHGTGTQTGDPAEMGAVANTFKHRSRTEGPLPVGGIKANFGHSEAAAGLAELLKSIKMFQTGIIPPQAGMPHALNPKFPDLSDINVEIPSEQKPFEKKSGKPRRILLNNFDAAGGNACMLLEEYVPAGDEDQVTDPRSSHVVTTSARTKAAYHANKAKLAKWLRGNPSTRLEDIAYTTTARRMHHPFRFACAATSIAELITKLEAPDSTSSASPPTQPIVFAYTGQGSHYAGMGAELYRTSPVFRETVEMCASLCSGHGFPAFNTVQVQLATITVELALTAFWRSAGLEPSLVIGHSLGEYAALHAAGVLSMADTLYLVGSRAIMLLERCEPGSCSMLSVTASAEIVRKCLAKLPPSSCEVACINTPTATVVSGTTEDLAPFQAEITTQDLPGKVRARQLNLPFAFHSLQMDSLLDDYATLAAGVTFAAPRIPVASTLLGSIVREPGIFNPEYLAQQMRRPVNFVGGLHAIQSELQNPVWLEIGPAPVCASFVLSTLSPSSAVMHSIDANTSNWTTISNSLSNAYRAGIDIDWLLLHKPFERGLRLVALPTYSWDMKDYWVTYTDKGKEAPATLQAATKSAPAEPYLATCAQYLVNKSSSPKIEVTFRAVISDPNFLTLIDSHKMQQIGLASGSVFCDAALSAAKYALEYSGRKGIGARSLSLHDPVLLAPLTRKLVGLDGELHTTAVMDGPSAELVLVSFKAVSPHAPATDLGTMTVRVRDTEKLQSEWDRVSYFIREKMDARIRSSQEGADHRLQPEVLYALFARNVEFGPSFKRIQEAYVARDYQEAAAAVVLEDDPNGSLFTFSPYWGEALAHLAGFMVNGNPQSDPRTTFIVMGFDGVEQTVDFEAGRKYMVYTRINNWKDNTAYCDAYVFDSESSKMVMQCSNLRYQELPRVVWKNVLEGGHSGSSHTTSAPLRATAKQPVKKTKEDAAAETAAQVKEAVVESTQHADEQPGNQVLETILDSILKATGGDASDLTPDTMVADLGVDSIMAIEIVSAVRDKTGVDIPVQFAFQYPTVGDLRREFGDAPAASQDTKPLSRRNSSSSEESASKRVSTGPATPAESLSSEESGVLVDKATATPGPADRPDKPSPPDDNLPQPDTRITLLHGSPRSGKTPFYMMADGTGTIATYIHLPPFKDGRPVYGVDSPFLRCPARLTAEVGLEGVARLVVDALAKHNPKGSFNIGGFSAGSVVAYEVARQLSRLGRRVEGLLVVDLCCPRPGGGLLDEATITRENDVGVAVFGAAVSTDRRWGPVAGMQEHLRAYLLAVRGYHPPPLSAGGEAPAASAAVIWAEKGMVSRVRGDEAAMRMLADVGMPTEPYPGFMEDPKNGPFACLMPDKTEADLGPNGWDRYVGDIMCLSVDANHLDLPMPGTVHLLHEQITKALSHFESST
ncbi:hypothetical protein KVR01_013237 [Diaporthe batatas]|uniref:uncharacterized protein n=1 Tax=Diaporthe batatas TaxID=748121 RepID=UPI001D04EE18|nr:uncharacterized protein KVR01_013237 [Diaporthe batatas]KAG8156824.1 hypothetical protein KVR01_013237 [Diaporthe batatas]